ncbi:hypothetical protein [Solitalea koreensis]|uniref:Lysozyme inhibitor of I-type lysozyme n=1 Tax=Solitalea koreensis TaxID=543615 RepID=A0A521E5D3_9SPHI|nr:hypothetical protein [Solitalea koreensis]SMO79085.1 hypothetical protein SAMN06265350_11144 [Solitalea koreensis]
MLLLKKYSLVTLLGLSILIGCKNASKNKTANEIELKKAVKPETTILGNYVSDGYEKRNEGYDWVAVSVSDLGNEMIKIKVRSRVDKKKPTCTFDAIAQKQDDKTYKSVSNGKGVLFKIENNMLSIASEFPEDDGILFFYCSGGASLGGNYKKINEAIDSTQVDKTLFSKILMLQDIGFNISSVNRNGRNLLTVAPFGLQKVNRAETLETKGQVINAEVEDLNADGSPEVLVFTKMEDDHQSGAVYGFSVNNKKSMSQIYFPPIAENSKLNKGYRGQDEFTIVETSLVQRFPLFEETSNGSQKTGKTRQISYKLKEGEAMRHFEVDKVSEY